MSEIKILWHRSVLESLPEGVDRKSVEGILRSFNGSGKYQPDGKRHQYQVGKIIVSVKAHGDYPLIYAVSTVEVAPAKKTAPKKRASDSAPRDTKQLIERIEAAGYRVERGAHNYKAYDGKHMIMTFATSPSDHRAVNNSWAQFRRYLRTKGEKQ